MQGRKKRWSKKTENQFIRLLETGATVKEAAAAIKISKNACYAHKSKSKEFAQAWEDAYAEGTDALEEVAIERAKEKSDVLLMFLLKSRDPERFRDRWQGKLSMDKAIELKIVNYEEPSKK